MIHSLPEGTAPHPRNRKPQRLSITIPWALYQQLTDISTAQGRSLSNLAATWLELHLKALQPDGVTNPSQPPKADQNPH